MNEPWRIELLGGFQARNEERTVRRFRSRQTAALLANLAYFLPRAHPREVSGWVRQQRKSDLSFSA